METFLTKYYFLGSLLLVLYGVLMLFLNILAYHMIASYG